MATLHGLKINEVNAALEGTGFVVAVTDKDGVIHELQFPETSIGDLIDAGLIAAGMMSNPPSIPAFLAHYVSVERGSEGSVLVHFTGRRGMNLDVHVTRQSTFKLRQFIKAASIAIAGRLKPSR